MSTYYREKLVKLHDVLFLDVRNARDSFVENESHWETAYFASKTVGDDDTKNRWNKVWGELNSKQNPYSFGTDFSFTISKKQSKSLQKYLLFVLEEYGRLRTGFQASKSIKIQSPS
jgi:hypothetical protein